MIPSREEVHSYVPFQMKITKCLISMVAVLEALLLLIYLKTSKCSSDVFCYLKYMMHCVRLYECFLLYITVNCCPTFREITAIHALKTLILFLVAHVEVENHNVFRRLPYNKKLYCPSKRIPGNAERSAYNARGLLPHLS